ncbi:MAG: hypothetical protein V4735_00120 [Pseudomonadota bacterium]
MATTTAFDFGNVEAGTVKLKVGDVKYSFLADGTVKLGETVLTDVDALKTAAKEFAAAAKTASAAEIADVKEAAALRGVFKNLAKKHADEVKGISGVFGAADEIEAVIKTLTPGEAAGADKLAKLKKILVAHPDSINLLEADASNVLKGVEQFKKVVDGVEKKVPVIDFAKLDGEVKSLRSTIDQLVTAHGGAEYTEESIKKLLASAPEGIKDVLPKEVVDQFAAGVTGVKNKANISGLDLNHIATTLETEIAAAQAEALKIGKEIRKLQAEKADSFFKGKLDKAIEAEGRKLDTLVTDNADIKHHIYGAMEKEFSAAEREAFKTVKTASSAMSSLASSASSTGEKGRGFFTKAFEFKRTQPWMEEVAKKEGKSVSEMVTKHGAIGSTRWGKVIGAGALVTGAVYAAVSALGNKGPGDRASEVANSRNNEPATGRA